MKPTFFFVCLFVYFSGVICAQARVPKLTLQGHTNDVMSLVFSSDGKTLVTGALDKTVIVWDVQTGQIKQHFKRHKGWVWFLALSVDAATIASGCYDTNDILVWDTQTGVEKQHLKLNVSSLSFSPDGEFLIGASGSSLYRWDVQTWKRNKLPSSHADSIYCITSSTRGDFLASGDMSGGVFLWDAKSWQPIQKTKLKNWIKSLAFFPDHQKMVIGSAIMDNSGSQIGGEVSVWDVSRQSFSTLLRTTDIVWAVAVSPNGKLIASAGKDGKIRIWDAQSEKLKETLSGHDKLVSRLAFSPDGTLLASCGGDKTIKLWEVSNLYWKAV